MTLTEFHIGIDDTDSESGGCTTYTAAVLFQELCNRGVLPSDFPWLVRLNPNIPWKTRGNGAVSLHIVVEEDKIWEVRDKSLSIVASTAELSAKRTDPAVVFLEGPAPEFLREYSTSALHDVLTVRHARKIARNAGVEIHLLKGNRGLIGALAALGASLNETDHTFEIIAYRTKENLGTKRRVDIESIRLMNSVHSSRTFHNLDPESGRVLVCPHGPDPVFLGVRGRSPHDVYEAFSMLRLEEPVERVAIFRTNQGTDAHLNKTRRIIDLARHQSTSLIGRVETIPRVLRGGHVIFRLGDETGSIWCAAYAPTGSLARASRELLPGDRVRAFGGIRGLKKGMLTLNVERIDVMELCEKVETSNPRCQSCGNRCESMGRGQGFRCKKCGLRDISLKPIRVGEPRKLVQATYLAAVQARRHLTRPEKQIV